MAGELVANEKCPKLVTVFGNVIDVTLGNPCSEYDPNLDTDLPISNFLTALLL